MSAQGGPREDLAAGARPEPLRPIGARPTEPETHYYQHCVNCGTLLKSLKCKLVCPKCGFYHSCSEP